MSLIVFGSILSLNAQETPAKKEKTRALPSVEVKTTDAKTVNTSTFANDGKPIVICFWATWCKPCVEEMPTIKNAINSLKEQDIQFLFASDESKEEIEAFDKEHQFGFNYVKTNNIEQFGIIGLPTTFIFDKEGKKIFSEMGYRKWDEKDNLDILFKSIK